MRLLVSLVPVLLFLLLGSEPVGAATSFQQVTKLLASDGAGHDRFGYTVAISGERIVVGAIWDDDQGGNSGSAYVFERDAGGPGAWGQVAKLVPPDGGSGDWFGIGLGLSGDTVVVGASQLGTDSDLPGYAYIYERDRGGPGAWGPAAKLVPPPKAETSSFGAAAAIDGDTALVGAWGTDVLEPYDGSVYVFHRNAGGPQAWGLVATLTAAKACELSPKRTACGWIGDNLFGASVAISGDLLLAGYNTSGYAYLFRRGLDGPGDWRRMTRLLPADWEEGEAFGYAVEVDGEIVVVGAYKDSDLGVFSGSAYVFEPDPEVPNGWAEAKLLAPDGGTGDILGHSVAVSGGAVVVGAPETAQSDPGYAYVFQRATPGGPGGWAVGQKLVAADAADRAEFGFDVAIEGDTIVIGASSEGELGIQAGAAYIFAATEVRPRLAVSGACPGEVVLAAEGLTPGGEAALYGATREGTSRLAPGRCSGTLMGLERATLLAPRWRISEEGTLRIALVLPQTACGGRLQLVDLASCATRAVEAMP